MTTSQRKFAQEVAAIVVAQLQAGGMLLRVETHAEEEEYECDQELLPTASTSRRHTREDGDAKSTSRAIEHGVRLLERLKKRGAMPRLPLKSRLAGT